AIEGTRGEGEVILNGAAARLVNSGDIVIIISYKQLAESELDSYRPRLIFVDGDNRIARTSDGVLETLSV
ncbi:MAG: aspartate 1-decarboxylase, partial [Chloroflexi bacterium]